MKCKPILRWLPISADAPDDRSLIVIFSVLLSHPLLRRPPPNALRLHIFA